MDKKTRLLERLRGDGRCCLATGVHPIFKAVTSNLKTKNKIKKYTYPHTHTKKNTTEVACILHLEKTHP